VLVRQPAQVPASERQPEQELVSERRARGRRQEQVLRQGQPLHE
jgi:hypothetical protein